MSSVNVTKDYNGDDPIVSAAPYLKSTTGFFSMSNTERITRNRMTRENAQGAKCYSPQIW
jgi:hypothetical protein